MDNVINNFIDVFKSIQYTNNGIRLSSNYNTDNKNYIWRDEDHNKPYEKIHYVMLRRNEKGMLSFAISKDAPDDEFYDKEEFYQDIDIYEQDNNESDDEFFDNCKKLIQSENIIIEDNFCIDYC